MSLVRIPRSVATRLWEQALHAPAQCVGGWVVLKGSLVSELYSTHPVPDTTDWHPECFNAQQGDQTLCPWQTFTILCPTPAQELLALYPFVLALDLQEPGVLSMRCFSQNPDQSCIEHEVVLETESP